MRQKLLLAGLAAIAFAAVGFIWWENREIIIRGETLEWWLGDNRSGADDYNLALAEMDSRCVRYLIRELQWQPSTAGSGQVKFPIIGRFGVLDERLDHRARAAEILRQLGSLSKPALPALRTLAHNPVPAGGSRDWHARASAAVTLILLKDEKLETWVDQFLDPNNPDWEVAGFTIFKLRKKAARAVPQLAQAFHTSTDPEFRGRIAFVLRGIQSDPNLSIPILRSLLVHETYSVRFQAIAGLANFGAEARVALPDLRNLLETDPKHRAILTNAIFRIDPESVHRREPE